MAPVSDRFGAGADRRGRDRAQLLLVGALSLAIALVAVALVLNSAIYTHNLASRQDTVSNDVVSFTRDVRAGGGTSLDLANRRVGNAGYGPVGNAYTDAVESMEGTVNERSAVDVAATRVSHVGNSPVHGVRVVDEAGDSFQPRSGSLTDWTVASGVRVRSFTMDVEPAGVDGGVLPTLDPSEAENVLQTPASASPAGFTVEFVADTDTWRVTVYEDGSGDPTVMVHEDGTDRYRSCSVPDTGESVRLDLTGARFGGDACAALTFVDDLSDTYTVEYYNGDLASGSYELYADVPIDGPGDEAGTFTDTVDAANYGEHCGGPTYFEATNSQYPRVVPAYYATELNLRYQGPDVEFAGTQRVAPGEVGPAPVSPRITAISVTDTTMTDGDAEFEVDVSATDPDGNLATVTVEIIDQDGDVGADDTTTVSGSSTTVSPFLMDDENDGPYTVRVTVTDGSPTPNRRVVEQTHVADGNGDPSDNPGCAP